MPAQSSPRGRWRSWSRQVAESDADHPKPKVIVVNYDSSWPEAFERLRAGIWPSFQDVATAIEHVGSTSVPGLAAKPVIDMTVVVPTPSAMDAVIARLTALG